MSLVAWFPLNGNINNYGTASLTLSYVNSANTNVTSAGKIGQCYYNNSNSAGALLSNETISLGSNQSMCCWVKFSSLESSASLGGAMVGTHRYSANTGMGLTIRYVSSTTGYLSINTGTGSSRTYNTYYGSTLLQANTWYHVAFTYDGSTAKLYVNGTEDGSFAIGAMSIPADYVIVGAWSLSGGAGNKAVHGDYKLLGYLNDVRIYNHTLSVKEIKDISKGLMLHYNFEDEYVEPTTNLVTQLVSGGKTSITNNAVVTNGENGDTYFYLKFPAALVQGTTYTISCDAEIPTGGTGTQWKFGMGSQSTSDPNFIINNGHNEYTFVCTANSAKQQLLFDDMSRIYGVSSRFYNFQVEQKDHATPYVSGTRAVGTIPDNSGYGNTGTINGAVQIKKDNGSGLHSLYIPNGVTDYISSNFRWPTDKITTQYWWKSTNKSPTGSYHIPFSSNSAGQYEMSISSSGVNRNGLYVAGARKVDNGTSTKLLDGNWHLCTMTYDGATIKRYVDGVSEKDTAATGALSGGTGLVLGHYGTNTSYGVKEGYMADVKIFATALSEADVMAEYNRKAAIDRNGNIVVNNYNEALTNGLEIEKANNLNAVNLAETMTLADGSVWVPICIHNVANGVLGGSSNTYYYQEPERWTNFGAINDMPRPESDYYEFYVMHQTAVDGAWQWFRFKQNKNPFSAAWADVNPSKVGTNVTRISASTTNNYAGMYWVNSSNEAMCFANGTNGNWYGCGVKVAYQGGIPGYNGAVIKGWQVVYMRVSSTKARLFKNNLIAPREIIER